MFTNLLFGVQSSPQRKICVALAVVLTLIGLIVIPVQGRDSENGVQGVFLGVAFAVLGLLSIAVIARVFAARDEKVATSEQLGKLETDYNVTDVAPLVSQGRPETLPPTVRGTIPTSGAPSPELQASMDRVRRGTGSPPR